jgi:hypothetical protein
MQGMVVMGAMEAMLQVAEGVEEMVGIVVLVMEEPVEMRAMVVLAEETGEMAVTEHRNGEEAFF